MSYRTLMQAGSFTSDATNKRLDLRGGFDYIEVVNETALIQSTADLAFKFTWQLGQTDGRGNVWTKLGNVANDPLTVAQIAADLGFVVLDTSGEPLSAAVALTTGTNITEPVFSTASTAGLRTGSIVRLTSMVGMPNLSGYDFAIDTVVTNTSFKMAAALATAPGAANTAGNWRIVKFDPIYYPRYRLISNITAAANAVVTVTVPSGYAVGQKVRVIVPESAQSGTSDFGMVEINELEATITAVNDAVGTQTVTLDIDSSAFTAFTFPTAAKAAIALGRAMLVPIGMNTATAIAQSVDRLSDAMDNEGFIGVELVGGATGPGGNTSDVMYWKTFKAFSVDNE